MNPTDTQASLFKFEESSPAAEWNQDSAQRALDELFSLTFQYKSSKAYRDLLQFVARFNFYSPFNAMLIHIQMPGATYATSPKRWLREYRRRIKANARPLVILQPMGPVMFVFDVSDTEPEGGAPPLPREVTHPFEVKQGRIGEELKRTVENAKRDGVNISEREAGSQSAGAIRSVVQQGGCVSFCVKDGVHPEYVDVPLRYELLLNSRHSSEAKYATLVHELGHLYCGHLGTPNEKWWPDRRGLPHAIEEVEAESICYLVCSRLGITNPSEEYLAYLVKKHEEVPPISLECVMKAAGLIEQMGRERLILRKDRKK